MENTQYLEVTVLSAEDLRIGGCPVSKNAYAVVRMGATDIRSTSLDRDGGSYPRWNETLHIPMRASSTSSSSFPSWAVEVRCKSGSRDRLIGVASVPLSDVLADYVPAHLVHYLSYRLREHDGERNGIVNLAVKMVGRTYAGQPWAMPTPVPKQIPMPTRMPAVAPRVFAGRNDGCTGVAIGVPVSYTY